MSTPLRRLLPVVRGASRLAIALARGARLPFSVSFMLTHRCNFQCAHCDIPAAAGAELSTEEIRRAIDELCELGLSRASFSGGEPLLRPDVAEILAHARGRGLFTSLNTNGWMVRRRLAEIAPSLDMLTLSLDGPEPAHDLRRRQSGSYRRVLEAIDAARAAGLAVATITTVGPDDVARIDEVLTLAERHGFWAYFQPAYRDCFDHRAGLDPGIDARLLADLAARLEAARSAGRPVAASPGFLERLARGPRFGDCATCHAGRYFATVMPDGAVVPCHLTSTGARSPNGREVGFARAFLEAPPPGDGPGCAISPYQETDLIFHLDRRAIAAAVERLLARPRGRVRAPGA